MRGHPLRTAGLVTAGAVVVAVVAAAGIFLYLRSYAPLRAAARGYAAGPGLGTEVAPTFGSGGKPVLIPAYRKARPFDTAFTVHNTGRFPVTLTGLAASGARRAALAPVDLLLTDSATASADAGNVHPFHRLRLDHGDTAILVVRWRLDCSGSARQTAAEAVPLRYSYLSLFERSETVTLPFAVTLRCVGGPPANP
ncbi:MAG: hypothetical protein V7644_2188 [Actinomycetota bacterium]|jgi:hypothetical protein